jgi:putative hydrolase of the HAD superfamily
MTKAYLFDWGDTLMVDFPDKSGRMMDWDYVEEVEGASETLSRLSKGSKIYVATGAIQATSESIKGALKRVNLDKYVSGYFCPREIGHEKPSESFYIHICNSIGVDLADVTMVGDSLSRDVLPALDVGMQAVWLKSKGVEENEDSIRSIKCLVELYS